MIDLLADLLELLIAPCYDLSHNWWVSILLLTIITKVALMPLALWVQKNSILMVTLMPDLNRLKVKYFGDSEVIGEKQNELYKEKKYHPLLSLVPLAVQILILFGLVDVIHLITDGNAPGTVLLGMVPFEDGGMSWFAPVCAGLSAVALGFAQNRINPLQREQSRAEKNMTNGLSIALSLVLGIFVATGMAFYWICSNLTAILVQVVCNLIIKPAKYINYKDLEETRSELEYLNSLSKTNKKWYQHDPLTEREAADYRRFFTVMNKHLVFYSERSGFYKYFQGMIQWVLDHCDARIHYITSDPNDQIFTIAQSEPRIIAYYIGEKRLITMMMKMDADIVVMTLEDLDNYYIKRSYLRKDIEYVFAPHHMTSTHLTPHKDAFDHFETFLCVGPHQEAELRASEKLYKLPAKNLVPVGYDLLDQITENYQSIAKRSGSTHSDRPTILIAPSWQEDCILDLCFDELVLPLLNKDWRIVVRPHPEYTKRYKARWDALQSRYDHYGPDEIYFEKDFSTNESIFTSDVLITDWSSVFCEFSFATLKPSLFIDTPIKVGNPSYKELGIEPTDISLRNQVGVSVCLDELNRAPDIIFDFLSNKDAWSARIDTVRAQTIFNLGKGGQMAGEYLVERILYHQKRKEELDHA